jgi:uncharacterized protein (DUF983 family)
MTLSRLQPDFPASSAVSALRKSVGAGKSSASGPQKALFCPCGAPLPSIAGLCASCYSRARHSARWFGGNRERALERDHRQCQACGSARVLHMHHRRAGDHGALVTLCAACHARIHRTRALRRWMPDFLLTLWREQHVHVPEQLQLSLAATANSAGILTAGATAPSSTCPAAGSGSPTR